MILCDFTGSSSQPFDLMIWEKQTRRTQKLKGTFWQMATAPIFYLLFLMWDFMTSHQQKQNKKQTTPTYAIETNTKRHIAKANEKNKKVRTSKRNIYTQKAAQLGLFATLRPIGDTIRYKLCVLTVSSRDLSICMPTLVLIHRSWSSSSSLHKTVA